MQDTGSRGPGPRWRRRKEARPAEVIAAATALWRERGFTDTRLDDVAAAAGIAKGTIYLYFPSKEALFEAAVEERLTSVMERTAEAVPQIDGTTETVLRGFFGAMLDQLLDHGGTVLLKILIAEGHRFPGMVQRYHEAAIAPGMRTIRAVLTRGEARGDLRPGASALDPRVVMAPLLMTGIWDLVFGTVGHEERERIVASHVGVLLGGLSRDVPTHPPERHDLL